MRRWDPFQQALPVPQGWETALCARCVCSALAVFTPGVSPPACTAPLHPSSLPLVPPLPPQVPHVLLMCSGPGTSLTFLLAGAAPAKLAVLRPPAPGLGGRGAAGPQHSARREATCGLLALFSAALTQAWSASPEVCCLGSSGSSALSGPAQSLCSLPGSRGAFLGSLGPAGLSGGGPAVGSPASGWPGAMQCLAPGVGGGCRGSQEPPW